MIRWTLDKRTQIELLGCLEELEICDESGQVMARLIPDAAYRRMMYDRAHALFTDEEIEAARQRKGPGRTLAEIMKDLESGNGALHRNATSPDAGESRGANSRICFVPPLAATFEVCEPDRLVEITGYKRMRPSA